MTTNSTKVALDLAETFKWRVCDLEAWINEHRQQDAPITKGGNNE